MIAGRDRLTAADSIVLLLGTIILLASVGGALQQHFGIAGIVATELGVVIGPALLVVRLLRLSPKAIGLRQPSKKALLGGLLTGIGGFYLAAAGIEAALERIAPVPLEVQRQMRELIVPESGLRPLVVDLVALALLPAACEELLFRGLILNAWRPQGRAISVTVAALAFGLFHLSLYKLVPTTALGVLAGVVAVRAESVLPAVALHTANNSLVLILVRRGFDTPPATNTALAIPLLGVALGLTVLGIGLAKK